MRNLHICIDCVVPDSVDTVRRQSERRVLRTLGPSSPPPDVVRMALLAVKMWENGKTLRCCFLNGTEAHQKRVASIAKTWEEFANIKFEFTDDRNSEIRIAFAADPRSWSAVGTDALIADYFPKHQPTMNFGWLNDAASPDEWRRVVLHEFGHALGCVHEHQSPAGGLEWDPEEVHRHFSGPPGWWTSAQIERNILRRYAASELRASEFDPHSIMLYMFPGKLFKSGIPTNRNTELSKQDKKFIASVYPKDSPGMAMASQDMPGVW